MRHSLARNRALLAVALVSACDLQDTVIATGDPVVLVQAVMRPDQQQQFILVERSFTGEVDPFVAPDPTPPNSPSTPITGAQVAVANATLADDPCAAEVTFSEVPEDPGIGEAEGVYWAPPGCPTMRVGDRLVLRVETAAGEVVTGETVVPALDRAVFVGPGGERPFGTDTVTFNRDRDTLGVHVEARAERALEIQVRRFDLPRDRTLQLMVDTTAVTLPGSILDVFIRGSGDETFLGGRMYFLIAAVVDTNMFDFIRSANNDVTGRGFINRLEGGVGVFGAAAAQGQVLRAVADQEDPREGTWRMSGSVGGDSVDLELEMFLARGTDSTAFSAFARGTWLRGPYDRTVDGVVNGMLFHAVVKDSIIIQGPIREASAVENRIEGVFDPNRPTEVRVFQRAPRTNVVRGTATLEKQ